ncbi:hypothetical protein RDI58_016621 [Solanum bulbocastanum]|uniref:Uncharacterized protein n=1 Tax=Solanum bulbocastanum TaxID=147425 RepID=A0AAN8YDX6_SOLBU
MEVYDEYSSVQHLQLVKEVALGPESQVLTTNKYCVNSFKFQTEEVSRNKKINNSVFYIQGDVNSTGQTIEYYGVIQEIIEMRDKTDWWVVIKSKHVERIEINNVLNMVYQNDVTIVQQQVDVELETTLQQVDVELETTLQHSQHILEEVFDDEILNVEEEISENEENESFDNKEWDYNENEITEEEEWENDGIETSEEEYNRHREHLIVRWILDNIILIIVDQSVFHLLHMHCLHDDTRTYLYTLFIEHDPYRRVLHLPQLSAMRLGDSSSEQSEAMADTPQLTQHFMHLDVSPSSTAIPSATPYDTMSALAPGQKDRLGRY